MKKNTLTATLFACSLALVMSCQKEESPALPKEPTFEEPAAPAPAHRFLLTMEGFTDNNSTKTYVCGDNVAWVAGDVVSLNGASYAIAINEEKASVEADFSEAPAIYGYYPADLATSGAQSTAPTVTIPASYPCSIDASGNQVIALPMAAYRNSGGDYAQFKHLTAAVDVMVWNATAATLYVDAVTISAAAYRLNGDCTLDLTAADYGLAADNDEVPAANRSVTVSFATPMAIEPGLDNAKSIQVPILPIGADAITIHVNSHNVHYDGVAAPAQTHVFNYTASAPALGRNVMLSAKVKMDSSSANVSSNGTFSVSATQTVYFSQGNLQFLANATGASEPPYTREWRFADFQWENLSYGTSASRFSESSNQWIDLFSYGTSGYDNGQAAYEPWSTNSYNDYPNDFPFLKANLTGNADWGYNAISNGGNTENSGWRTLSAAEWDYLLNQRPGNRYVPANIDTQGGHPGYILLPDNWDTSLYDLNNYNVLKANKQDNTISITSWYSIFSPNGAVFIRENDFRGAGTSTVDMNYAVILWTSTWGVSSLWNQYEPFIVSSNTSSSTFDPLHSSIHPTRCGQGFAVRLARNAN